MHRKLVKEKLYQNNGTPVAQANGTEEPTDKNGRTFDPAFHAVHKETGEPRLTSKGNLICLPKSHIK